MCPPNCQQTVRDRLRTDRRGFFRGEYLGMDLLVNALLLLVAYLFVVRFLLRRAFGLGAQRLTRSVAERLRAELVQLGANARDDVSSRVRSTLVAIDGLTGLEDTFRAELSRGEPELRSTGGTRNGSSAAARRGPRERGPQAPLESEGRGA